VLADRGYAHRRGLWHVRKNGAHFVVRTNWKNVPLCDLDGQNIDILARIRDFPEAAIGDFDVRVKSDARAGQPALDVRLVVLRKSEAAAERSRVDMVRHRGRQVKTLDPRSLEAAGFVLLLTSLPRSAASASDVLEFYRWRWQIEMTFKRLKGLIRLGDLPIRDPRLARSYLYAKFLAALLLDDFTQEYLAFSPWGFNAAHAPIVLVENPAGAA